MVRGKPPSLAVERTFDGRTVSILDVLSGNEVSLKLSSPETQWPSSLPIDPGAEYQAIISGVEKVISFQLVEINGGPDLSDAILRQLAAANCVDRLLDFAAAVEPVVDLKN